MKHLLTGAISLGLGLASLSGVASAQTPAGISTNADGSYVSSRAGVNPTADGGGGTVIYGDITTGPGYHVIGAPTASTAPAPEAMPGDSAPADVPEDTAVPAGSGAVASDTDADADNIADALEWDLGLDPGNADTDGDGVADGDEIAIYSTDPVTWDTDGDGISDGEELFGSRTDPLVWDEQVAQPDLILAQEAAKSPDVAELEQDVPVSTAETVSLPQGTTQNVTAVDGDAATRGSGGASASPGTVTRGGGTTLGPNGSHVVSDAPSNVTITGDTDVIAPLDESSNASLAPDSGTAYSCGGYGDWYDAQVAYENAGATAADPAMVQALDPDYDGIACEEGMA